MNLRSLLFPSLLLLLGQAGFLRGQDCEVPGTAPKDGWLLESDSLVWSRELHNEVRDGFHSSSLGMGNLLLSRGLTEHLDIQFGYGGWLYESRGAHESLESHIYSGDATLRMKWACWGADGKTLAFALLPYCSRKVHGGGCTTHGVLVPASLPLPQNFILNAQVGLERHAGETTRWATDVRGNLCLTRCFGPRWSAYVELRTTMPCKAPRAAYSEAGPGLILNATERLVVELEYFSGLDLRAPDWTTVLRLSWSL